MNTIAKLEGLINGLIWAKQTGKPPLVVEGDSQIIINMTRKLQARSLMIQVSKNWGWESRLSTLRQILIGEEALLLTHVKREGNRVADAMSNSGVESEFSFHAEIKEDEGKTQQVWKGCSKVAEEDMRKNELCNAWEGHMAQI